MNSSNIGPVEYDVAKREMIVTFRSGETYVYTGVDNAVYHELLESPSPGGFFHRNIRERYPYYRRQ